MQSTIFVLKSDESLFVSVEQETLLNLLLRNYLHYNLYDQAEKLCSKTQRSESHSNQQVSIVKYL